MDPPVAGLFHCTLNFRFRVFRQETALATRSEATRSGWGFAAAPGSVVRTTQTVSVSGSAHASVPEEPEWPNVFSEQPGLPAPRPTENPRPRGTVFSGL